jgi:hypothetical protein
MRNPWLKKNPYMSMWLSGANAMAGATRGIVTAQAQRQASQATRQLTQVVMDAWLEPLTASSRKSRKRR